MTPPANQINWGAKLLAIFSLILALTGCVDPVAKLLKQNGHFYVERPPKTGIYIGDIFQTKTGGLLASLSDAVKDPDAYQAQYVKPEGADMPSLSGSSNYKFSANVTYLTEVSGSLQAIGAKSYSVTFGGVKIYEASAYSNLAKNFLPLTVAAVRPDLQSSIKGTYAVSALMYASTLDYSFQNSSGGTIDLTGSNQATGSYLNAKLGTSWSTSSDGSLSLTGTRCIGYELVQITDASKPAEPKFHTMKMSLMVSRIPKWTVSVKPANPMFWELPVGSLSKQKPQ